MLPIPCKGTYKKGITRAKEQESIRPRRYQMNRYCELTHLIKSALCASWKQKEAWRDVMDRRYPSTRGNIHPPARGNLLTGREYLKGVVIKEDTYFHNLSFWFV